MKKCKDIINKHKNVLLIVLCLSLFSIIRLGTIAYLSNISEKSNSFITGIVSSTVLESFTNNIKSNVQISNSGNVSEYVRVFINIYYKDEDGVILTTKPVLNTDYSLTMGSSSNWLYNSTDHFYYYKLPLSPNTSTDILISDCRELIAHNDRVLNVDIYSQTIQAEPVSTVSDAWGVTLNNDNTITLGG